MKRTRAAGWSVSTGLTQKQAEELAATDMHNDSTYGVTGWDHGYNERLAWKLYNEGEQWLVCLAQFVMLYKKRGLKDISRVESLALYYMARAQARAVREAQR